MAKTMTGNWGKPIVALLDPNSDLLEEILQVARDHKIKAGVVHSIVGAFEKATMQVFDKGGKHSHPVTIDGPLECHGGGIIGTVDAPLRGDQPFGRGGPTRGCDHPEGVGGYVHGDAYVHLHLTVTVGNETISGHVMPGCIVRSHHPISHTTVMISPIENLALKISTDGGPDTGNVGVYHKIERTS